MLIIVNVILSIFCYRSPQVQDYNNMLLSWSQFCKEPLSERNFTFWEWFFAVMKVIISRAKSDLYAWERELSLKSVMLVEMYESLILYQCRSLMEYDRHEKSKLRIIVRACLTTFCESKSILSPSLNTTTLLAVVYVCTQFCSVFCWTIFN